MENAIFCHIAPCIWSISYWQEIHLSHTSSEAGDWGISNVIAHSCGQPVLCVDDLDPPENNNIAKTYICGQKMTNHAICMQLDWKSSV